MTNQTMIVKKPKTYQDLEKYLKQMKNEKKKTTKQKIQYMFAIWSTLNDNELFCFFYFFLLMSFIISLLFFETKISVILILIWCITSIIINFFFFYEGRKYLYNFWFRIINTIIVINFISAWLTDIIVFMTIMNNGHLYLFEYVYLFCSVVLIITSSLVIYYWE